MKTGMLPIIFLCDFYAFNKILLNLHEICITTFCTLLIMLCKEEK